MKTIFEKVNFGMDEKPKRFEGHDSNVMKIGSEKNAETKNRL
jgi:hypothetical protein